MKKMNEYGVPIFKSPNAMCKYCFESNSKKDATKFPICTNPLISWHTRISHSAVIGCPSQQDECDFYVSMEFRSDELELAEKLVQEYSEQGWMLLPLDVIKDFVERMEEKNVDIMKLMIRFFGYTETEDDYVDTSEALLFTCLKNENIVMA